MFGLSKKETMTNRKKGKGDYEEIIKKEGAAAF